jgi:hypothetical protein
LTVCIAAICNFKNTIFGACDRMMTSGDIEFEPDLPKISESPPVNMWDNANPKIYVATTSMVFMTAGDSGLQTEIMADVMIDIRDRTLRELKKWLDVKDAVESYLEAYNKAKAARVRDTVLIPRGLDANTFISRQSEMRSEFILETTRQIHRCEADFRDMYGVETIITGIDNSGSHIYAILKSSSGDHVTCCDSIGFAAVGIGGRHAESQFMMAGHNPPSNRDETLLLTYMAKKRSEVAPGVGRGTDMFTIGPMLGSVSMLENIPDFDMKRINSIYKKMEQEQAKRFKAAKKKTKEYIAEMFASREQAKQQQQQPTPELPSTPPTAPPQTS